MKTPRIVSIAVVFLAVFACTVLPAWPQTQSATPCPDCRPLLQTAYERQAAADQAARALANADSDLAQADRLDAQADMVQQGADKLQAAANEFHGIAADSAARAAAADNPQSKAAWSNMATDENKQADQYQSEANEELAQVAKLRGEATALRNNVQMLTADAKAKEAAAAAAWQAYNTCRKLPPCPQPGTNANPPATAAAPAPAPANVPVLPAPAPAKPQVFIQPGVGGPPDSVVKTDTFTVRMIVPPGNPVPDNITVNIANNDKFFHSSQTVTLTASPDPLPGGGTLFVSGPLKIDSGKAYIVDWIRVDGGGTLNMTATVNGVDVTSSFQVYNTAIAQAVGRNAFFLTKLKDQLTNVVTSANQTLTQINTALQNNPSAADRQKLLTAQATAQNAINVANIRIQGIDMYFSMANFAASHPDQSFPLYMYTDQYKLILGNKIIPFVLSATPNDRTDLNTIALNARDQAIDAVNDIEVQAAGLLAIGLYQATTEITLAGPVFTLLSPVANRLTSEDGSWTGMTIWGTQATSADYINAATSVLMAAAMMKGVPLAVDAFGNALVTGTTGPISIGEFVITPGSTEPTGTTVGVRPGPLAGENPANVAVGDTGRPAPASPLPVNGVQTINPDTFGSNNAILKVDEMGRAGFVDQVAANPLDAGFVKIVGAEKQLIDASHITGLDPAVKAQVASDLFAQYQAGIDLTNQFINNPQFTSVLDPEMISDLHSFTQPGNVKTLQSFRNALGLDAPTGINPQTGAPNAQVGVVPLTPNLDFGIMKFTDVPRPGFPSWDLRGTSPFAQPTTPPATTVSGGSAGRPFGTNGALAFGNDIKPGNMFVMQGAVSDFLAGKSVSPEGWTTKPIADGGMTFTSPDGKLSILGTFQNGSVVLQPNGFTPGAVPMPFNAGAVNTAPLGPAAGAGGAAGFRLFRNEWDSFRPGGFSLSGSSILDTPAGHGWVGARFDFDINHKPALSGFNVFNPFTGSDRFSLSGFNVGGTNAWRQSGSLHFNGVQWNLTPSILPGAGLLPSSSSLFLNDGPLLGNSFAGSLPWPVQTDRFNFNGLRTAIDCGDTVTPQTGGFSFNGCRLGRDGDTLNFGNGWGGNGLSGGSGLSFGPLVSGRDTRIPSNFLRFRLVRENSQDMIAGFDSDDDCDDDEPEGLPDIHNMQGFWEWMFGVDDSAPAQPPAGGRGAIALPRPLSNPLVGFAGYFQPVLFLRPSPVPIPAAPAHVAYAFVANGKSTGAAIEAQILDASGVIKKVRVPEGTVLEPVAEGAAKPLAAAAGNGGANVVKQTINAFCLDFHKLPPAPGTIYRIADPDVQAKYRPIRYVEQAARQMFVANKLHPVGDPKDYADGIRQYAIWTKLEGWTRDQFTQAIVDRTKKNADEMHVKWTDEMEKGLRAAIPGLWGDVTQVLGDSSFLEQVAALRTQARTEAAKAVAPAAAGSH